MSREYLYLAYGSNLHPERLRQRTPSARLLGTTSLEGWGLRWHKRSVDGSAKCDVAAAPGGALVVHGAVYAIAAPEWAALDAAEGAGYAAHALEIPEYGRVFLYRARPQYVVEGLRPYRWYRDYVLWGARYHGFPAPYIAQIFALPWDEDPDPRRARHHERAVAALSATVPRD
ncbi:MAG: gamma-glutamylcyclotransferase family protein [Gammaproteobacteria bacterium]|nr:gamma-glutamylcyclotransferase family protein [Gammaproteobacteria bacterium]